MMRPATSEREPTSGPRRVLVVGTGIAAGAVLETELPGVSVEVESDRTVALARLVADDDIDCAVVEHDPPRFDGVEFVRTVREDALALPLILYVAGLDEDTVAAAMDAGASDVVDATTDETRTLLTRRVETALLVVELHGEARHVREGTADGVLTLDDQLRVRESNERAATLLDRHRDRLVGERAFASARTEDGEPLETVCRSVLQTGEATTVRAHAPDLDRWFDVRMLPDGDRLRVFVTDITEQRSDEQSLAFLVEATRSLVGVESFETVGEYVAAGVDALLTGARTTLYLFDGEANVLRPVTGDGNPISPGDGSPVWDAFTGADSVTVRTPERAGERRAVMASLGSYGILVVESEEADAVDERTVRLIRVLAASTTQTLERLQQETTLEEREWELKQQTYRLERLHQVTEKLLRVEKATTQSRTREEAEQAVCEELTKTDRFSFVWVGSVDENRERVVARAWDGAERGYLKEVDLSLTAENTEPGVRAIRDREVVRVPNVSHGLREEPWRRELLNRGHQSVLALPIVHEGTLYGVLTVCASVPEAFDDISERFFDEIADTIAFGVDTLERRQALLADSVVELDVRLTDPDDPIYRLAGRVDGTVSLEGVVSEAGAEPMLYLTVTDSSEDVLSSLRASTEVRRAERVTDREDGGLFVVGLSEPTFVTWITQAGGAVQELTASPAEMRLEVELPRPADIREFIDRLQAEYPSAEIRAQQSHERPIESRQTFMARLTERLTERQLEVLKTAYFNGYFEWPRTRTGEEIANLLDITQPTFNNHLRVAERKLFTMLFEDEREP